ncbi:MAG TPA: azurin [Balneolaceae bacterium]|nr:azurin [Balneolaceae bacterium]|tara:strand:+ start:201411 stop:201872 length:462 start_codon:yes stop_codon:yes gene_type:complete
MNILVSLLLILFVSNPFTNSSIEKPAANDDKVEITIEANDQMRFNLSEIKVKEGDTVVLTLKHVGKLPKAAMGHNWVLLKKDVAMADFAKTAMTAKATDYIPEGTEDVIVHTKMLGGGEETTIEFEAPAKGEYTFICSFPGHYALMNGKFIVE